MTVQASESFRELIRPTVEIYNHRFTVPSIAVPNAQVQNIQTVADVAGSLNNTYFLLYSAQDKTEYYVWFNVAGGGTDPAVPNKTGVEVAIASGATDDAVATAMRSAIGGLADFGTGGATNNVTITNAASGQTTDASDSAAAPTGFTFDTPTTDGGGLSIEIAFPIKRPNGILKSLKVQCSSTDFDMTIYQKSGEDPGGVEDVHSFATANLASLEYELEKYYSNRDDPETSQLYAIINNQDVGNATGVVTIDMVYQTAGQS